MVYVMANHPNRCRGLATHAANPTPAEIMQAREASGLSQAKAGSLVYAGLRSWQHWEGGTRRMHPAFWELFRRKVAGLVKE